MTLGRYIVTADVTIPAGTSSSPASGPATTGTSTTSSATPGAGTTVATQAASAGTFLLSWTVTIAAAAAAGDAGNFGLYAGSVLLATSVNPGTIGTYPQQAVTTYLGAGATVTVQNIAAGSAGAVYSAVLSVTPLTAGDVKGSVAWDGAGSPAGWTGGGFAVKFLQGTPLWLDPAGDLFAAIGAGNLRAWIDGTDTVSHGHWGAISNLCSINQRLPGKSSTRRPPASSAARNCPPGAICPQAPRKPGNPWARP